MIKSDCYLVAVTMVISQVTKKQLQGLDIWF